MSSYADYFLFNVCVPDTGPMHVLPVYGTVIELGESWAVPVSVIAHGL